VTEFTATDTSGHSRGMVLDHTHARLKWSKRAELRGSCKILSKDGRVYVDKPHGKRQWTPKRNEMKNHVERECAVQQSQPDALQNQPQQNP
jgi:hypothetical protein